MTVKITKAVGAVLLALCVLLGAAGCGSAPSGDLSALREAMLAADASLPQMKTADSEAEDGERLFGSLSDVDYNKVAHYFLAYAADGSAYEIAVIEAKSPDDMAEIKASLERHLDSRKSLYKNYAPEQLPQAEQARILVKGSRAALIMCADVDAVEKVFQ